MMQVELQGMPSRNTENVESYKVPEVSRLPHRVPRSIRILATSFFDCSGNCTAH